MWSISSLYCVVSLCNQSIISSAAEVFVRQYTASQYYQCCVTIMIQSIFYHGPQELAGTGCYKLYGVNISTTKQKLLFSHSFLMGLSLCFICSDQHVKYWNSCVFPSTNSLLLDIQWLTWVINPHILSSWLYFSSCYTYMFEKTASNLYIWQ